MRSARTASRVDARRKPLLFIRLIADVLFGAVALAIAGITAMRNIKLDATPDLSDPQVIVFTEWMGRSPTLVEDQVTYPLVTALLGAPHVVDVRGQTMFGMSFVYVIFEEGTDVYWARSRVLEYLNTVRNRLPAEANTRIGPDATGIGWVYQYALVDRTGRHDLGHLARPRTTDFDVFSNARNDREIPRLSRTEAYAGHWPTTSA